MIVRHYKCLKSSASIQPRNDKRQNDGTDGKLYAEPSKSLCPKIHGVYIHDFLTINFSGSPADIVL